MRLTRSRATAEPAQTAPTHVLHWVPGWLNSDGLSLWELQDAAAYIAGEPYNGSDPQLYDWPRDAADYDLAIWVIGQLGYPVDLEPAIASIRAVSLRPVSVHADREPIYYVRPAST
jgi:hypothetical protein